MNYRPTRKRGLILVITVLFLLVSAGCSKKSEPVKSPDETPMVTAPGVSEEAVDEKAPDSNNAVDKELNEEELKDLFSKGKDIKELSYTMVMMGYQEKPLTTKVWMKDGKMRFETTIMGNTVITMIDGDAFYSMSENDKMAMKMPISDVENPTEDIFTVENMTEDIDSTSFNYLGKEKLDGIDCYVIESTDDFDGATVKMWLHETYGMVMRMETIVDNEMGSYVMEVKDFDVGKISDDIFTISDDYQIVDFSDFEMPMMPDMPVRP